MIFLYLLHSRVTISILVHSPDARNKWHTWPVLLPALIVPCPVLLDSDDIIVLFVPFPPGCYPHHFLSLSLSPLPTPLKVRLFSTGTISC